MTDNLIYHKNKCFFLLMLVQFLTSSCYAQENPKPAVESFESKDVLNLYDASNSKLSLSTEHRRFGKKALQWEWNGKSSFETSNFRILSRDESPLKYGSFFPSSPTLIMSLYNEEPQNEKITISYGKDGKQEVWFDIELSFKGWRHIWVPFYEMEGNAPKKEAAIEYDYFKISTNAVSGKLFFDDIIFSQYQDDRHAYPDFMVPFIKADRESGLDHWIPLIKNQKQIETLNTTPISVAIKLDLLKIEKGIDEYLAIAKKYKVYIDTLRDQYQKLHLKAHGNTVLGPPLTFQFEQEYFNKKQQGAKKYNGIGGFGKVIKRLANLHDRANPSEKQEIETMFLTASKYFLDQGWQAGASGGTRHHIGYSVRDITEAFYVMRKPLKKAELLNDIGNSLQWLYNLGMVLGDENNFHVNIDYLNTQSYYHLMLIFLSENKEKQAALLKAYSRFISIILAQKNEERGFKIDGTSWHHNGHYPAYGMGAFRNVPKVIRALSGTRYRIRPEGHKNFKKAFLTTGWYSQLFDYGFGNAGRHPLENSSIKILKEQYLQMAYSGNPEGISKIDKEVAAAYLRLWGKKDVLNSTIFINAGIEEEKLAGYKILSYAATAIHRRNDWAAIIKGYSKYVWASEIYVASNRYGRYPANGTIQLLNKKGEKGSGFQQEGWDWNRYPGATVIYLPFEELEPDTPLLMFRSEETFAGAVELDGNGVFGMILNEDNGSNADGDNIGKIGFPGKLKAKKSVFSFGNKLICIGTNISSIDEKNPVQTNLFQSHLTNSKNPLYTSIGTITKFPYQAEFAKNTDNWLVDPYGNGYHILSTNNSVKILKKEQHSYHNKYSVRTGAMHPRGKGVKETEGDYATAWINHGNTPENASYQYVIYPFLNQKGVDNFDEKTKNDKSYTILKADSIAHIVLDKKTSTTGYVIFEANKNLKNGILKEVSAPSLIMVRQDDVNTITISAVQPDLNFEKNKKEKFSTNSTPVQLTLTLNGKWNTRVHDSVKSIDNSTDVTMITLECKDGFSTNLKLQKK